jgi:hypothetical protein
MLRRIGFLATAGLVALAAGPLGAQLTDSDGFINKYLVLGSYQGTDPTSGWCDPGTDITKDFLSDGSTTEADILPVDGMVLGSPVNSAWLAGRSPCNTDVPTVLTQDVNDTLLDFNIHGGTDNAMSYAFIYVNNKTGRGAPATVGLGSDDSGAASVNHTAVLEGHGCRGVGTRNIENLSGPVTLLPGWNLVTFKVFNGGGGYGLVGQLTDGINNGKPIVDDGVNFQFALELPAGESLATPPAAVVPTRQVTVTNPTATTTVVDVTLSVNSGGQPCTVVEKVPAVFTIDSAGGAQVQPGSLGEATRQYLANAVLPAILTWQNVTDSVSYRISRTGYFRAIANDNNITGSVALLDAVTSDSGTSNINGALAVPNFVGELLVTPPMGQIAGAKDSTWAPSYARMLGGWIADGAGTTDENIVPEDGMSLSPAFGTDSNATGFLPAGDPLFNNAALVKVTGTGTYNWNTIYGGGLNDAMNIAYFYLVNPDPQPRVFYLDVGTDDSPLVRVNGKDVWKVSYGRGVGQGDRFSVWADPGKNLVAIYCFQGGGDFQTFVRLEEPWGNSAPNGPYVTTDATGYDPSPAAHTNHGLAPSPYHVVEALIGPPLRMNQGGCATTPDMINGPWLVGSYIESGDAFTDATIVPSDGLLVAIEYGTSQAVSLDPANAALSPRAADTFYFNPATPSDGGIFNARKSISGYWDLQRDDIFNADPNNICTPVAFYAVNPGTTPMYVNMGVGSDDGVGVRVNGFQALTMQACRGNTNFQDKFRVQLDPGKNLVVLYVMEDGGGTGASARFEDDGGNGISVLTTIDPAGYDPATHQAPAYPPVAGYTKGGIVTDCLITAAVMDNQWGQWLRGAPLTTDFLYIDGLEPAVGAVHENATATPATRHDSVTTGIHGGGACTTLERFQGTGAVDPGLWNVNAMYGGYQDNITGTLFFYLNNKTTVDQKVWLGLGSDDSAALFVNNQSVLQAIGGRGWGGGNEMQNMAPATLKPGQNLVQASYDNGGGDSGLRVGVFSGSNRTLLDPAVVQVVADPFGPSAVQSCIAATGPADEDAFKEMEYVAQIHANGLNGGPSGSSGITYEVTTPAGATVSTTGQVNYQIPANTPIGSTIDFAVRASQLGATSDVTWKVKVVRSVRLDFASLDEVNNNFDVYLGDGTAQFANSITLEANPLHVVLPGPGNPDFDSWCGHDRTPRLRDKIKAFSTFDLEAHLMLDPANFPATTNHHVGLAIDRGQEDLEIWGIYGNQVLRERTCNSDGQNGGNVFDPSFNTPGVGVTLRIEKRGDNIKYFAKLDTDTAETMALELNGSKNVPIAVGLGMKTWGGETNTGVIVDYVRYGTPITVTATWGRCDANGDGAYDISDPVASIAYQFLGGPAACPAALDCNSDGSVDISDVVFDIAWQFLGGPKPADPYPACDNFVGCSGNSHCQ